MPIPRGDFEVQSTPGTRGVLVRTLRPVAILAAAILLWGTPGLAAQGEPAPDRNSPGVDHTVGREPLVLDPGNRAADELQPPLTVRLMARWSDLEPRTGSYTWEALDQAVRSASEAGARIILTLHGGHPVHTASRTSIGPGEEEALDAWTALLRAASERFGGSVWAWQVGSRPDDAVTGDGVQEAARDFAFFYKRSALAIRSARPEALVALPTVSPSSAEFVSELYRQEVAPYADALSVSFGGGEDDRAGLATMAGLLLVHDPSARLWVNGVQVLLGMEGYGQILRAWTAALEREAALVTFDDPPDGTARPYHMALLQNIRGLFGAGYAPLVESGRGVRALAASGEPLPGGRVARFFDGDTKTVLMVYDGGVEAQPGEFGVFVVDTVDMAGASLHDLAAGESAPNVALQKDESAGLTRVALPLAPYPLVLSYERFTSPEYAAEGEKLDVTREKLPDPEEIIARYQAVQDAQNALLKSVRASADEEWHFTTGTTGSVDIMIESGFYLDPEVGAEWEHRKVFINGVRWRGDKLPEFPFLMPERAVSLPLQVSLSKAYRYKYAGREMINGFDCHVISFEPAGADPTLSRGRVWIDTGSYARIRVAQVQDNLAPPITSNDQRDTYAPVKGPEGYTYWILSRIDTEQIWSALGEHVVFTKKVRLNDFVINGSDFEERRGEALASNRTMMRETEKGLRYLDPGPGGTRTVKDEASTMSLFVVGGVLANESFDFPVPLAGINWFEADLAGRGVQADVFFAGALVLANISDPEFLGTPLQASSNLVGLAVSGTDRIVRERPLSGRLVEEEREEIGVKPQTLSVSLGLPFWTYFKLEAGGQLSHRNYSRTDETCGDFVTPRDTYVRTGILSGEFNWRQWSVEMSHEWSHRTRHEPWGLDAADPNGGCLPTAGGPRPPDFFEAARDYVRYEGTLARNFYLPRHQKIFFRLTGQGSRDMDRFSKYQVSLFGNRIRGFSGGGIHYTNGGIFRADYAFSLGEVVRLGAGVDFARIKDRQQLEPFRNHVGAGISANFVAPWNMLVRLEYGIALDSDIPQFEGEQEILLTVLKLFSQH